MADMNTQQQAEIMADLTFKLLENCQEKQEYISRQMNLSVSEFKCMRAFRDDKVLSVKEIASRMNLTSSRLTRIIDGLVTKNLVSRDLNHQDRRFMDVALTAQGETITRRLNAEYVKIHLDILNHLDHVSRPEVLRALDELYIAMSAWGADRDIE